jgi:hypothetical protein
MQTLSRLSGLAHRVRPYWRLLWALAILGGAAVGIAAPGDLGFP